MKNINKNLLKIGLLSSMLFGIASCGEPTSSSSPEGSKPSGSSEQTPISSEQKPTNTIDFEVPEGGFDTTKEVSISFYHTMGQTLLDVFTMYLEEFNEEYPNIKVKPQFVGNYDDVRDTSIQQISSGEQACNLAYCYPDHVAMYNQAKSVISLDNLIIDEDYGLTQEQEEDFIEAYYEEGREFGDGKMYSLPFSKSSEVLYYDASFFEEHSLNVPDHWFSVDANDTTSMEYVCAEIKKINPDSTPLGYDSDSNLFITLSAQSGAEYTSAIGDKFKFNNDENKAFVKKLCEWRDKGYITTKAISGTYTSSLFTALPDAQGVNSRSYMCIGSSAGASYQRPEMVGTNYRFDVGICPIPQMDVENNPAVIQQGPNICIFNDKDPQKVLASWILLKYFTTNVEFQAQFSMVSGYSPVIKSVYENVVYKDWLENSDGGLNIQALSVKVTQEQSDWFYTSPAFVGSSKARDEVGKIVTECLSIRNITDAQIDSYFATAITNCEY